jgi:serine/threonine protein kinase
MGVTIDSVARAPTEVGMDPVLASSPPPSFELGELVADAYLIRGVLGAGGMGRVFAADDLDLQRSVAIKTALVDGGQQLRREAQALAQIHHRNVVPVYRWGIHRHVPFLVMQRLYGMTACEYIGRRAGQRALELGEVIDILIGIADGLTALHEAGIAHLDLKPGNVILGANGRVVLVDLGIMLPEVSATARPPCGTATYMAPELIEDGLVVGRAGLADLYSFGVMAFELITGAPPFVGPDVPSILACHLVDTPPHLADVCPGIPMRLAALIGLCLAKHPSERPSRAEEIAWELRAIRRVADRLTVAVDHSRSLR